MPISWPLRANRRSQNRGEPMDIDDEDTPMTGVHQTTRRNAPQGVGTASLAPGLGARLRGGARDSSPDSLFDSDGETEAALNRLSSTKSPSPAKDIWTTLYGFQGSVPFLVGDAASYLAAVRQLLSIPAAMNTPYTLVHYQSLERSLTEIKDDLATGSSGAAVRHIQEHFASANNNNTNNSPNNSPNKSTGHSATCCVLFVRLQTETGPAPGQFKPSNAQLGIDVGAIKYLPPGRQYPSTAYFPYPKNVGRHEDSEDGEALFPVREWNARQYLEHFRTAVDVLLGRPGRRNGFHHAVLRLHKETDPEGCSYAAPTHGILTLRPSDLQDIQPYYLAKEGLPGVGMQHHALDASQIHLTLPGFYPDLFSEHASIVAANTLRPVSGRLGMPSGIAHIQNLVRTLLAREADGVTHILLLSGRGTLGSVVDRIQPTALIPLSKSVRTLDAFAAHDLCQLLDSHPRSLLLYPQYMDDNHGDSDVIDTRMHAAWDTDADMDHKCTYLPSLDSSVDIFRGQVARLVSQARGAGRDADRVNLFDATTHEITIRAVLLRDITTPDIEFSTFVIGPDSTDDEWFAIRAQIPTRNAEINVWLAGTWDWDRGLAKSNVWGPRYGKIQRFPPKIIADSSDSDSDSGILAEYSQANLISNSPSDVIHAEYSQDGSDRFQASINAERFQADLISNRASDGNTAESLQDDFPFNRFKANITTESPEDGITAEYSHDGFATNRSSASTTTESSEDGVATKFTVLKTASTANTSETAPQKTTPPPTTADCPFPRCGFIYNPAHGANLATHVLEAHASRKCMWCDEPIPESWTDAQRDAHARTHRDRLLAALGVQSASLTQGGSSSSNDKAVAVKVPLKQAPRASSSSSATTTTTTTAAPIDLRGAEEEDQAAGRDTVASRPVFANQRFCDRCGRDRSRFLTEAERTYHDRHCVPGVYHGARCRFCRRCGDYRWASGEDRRLSGRAGRGVSGGSCGHDDEGAARFCARCGLDVGAMEDDEDDEDDDGGAGRRAAAHDEACRGFGAQPGRFCPHCGVAFWEGHAQADWLHNTRHIEACRAAAAAAAITTTITTATTTTAAAAAATSASAAAALRGKKRRPLQQGDTAAAADDDDNDDGQGRGRGRKRRRLSRDDDLRAAQASDHEGEEESSSEPEWELAMGPRRSRDTVAAPTPKPEEKEEEEEKQQQQPKPRARRSRAPSGVKTRTQPPRAAAARSRAASMAPAGRPTRTRKR
ncbi:hypothetical protein VFPFJ_07636 [Purpureocillium lilacinum]|uniref:Uncharacterized protein n=1 Tax=Purpureocillium lilacinum TaxID=33203 RepID=A0A179H508_PURLI|nr:hypothetical protein VFPFJ_07636 [Purpureocillium lilacinum]OAQ85247.1 hypothetical protein VFPFJ_07636 [Purpureocillium lilacinum]